MTIQSAKWSDFWRNERQGFLDLMKLSTLVFAERFDRQFKINSNHLILDFGCGPGFFIDYLAAKGVKISGVDINPFFVEECKRRHPQLEIFPITSNHSELGEALTAAFGSRKFDFVVLLSVSQYFEDRRDLASITGKLTHFLCKGGRILIADVVTPETSSLRDLAAVFRHCVSTGNTFKFFRFIRYLLFSNYRQLSRAVRLQSYTVDDIRGIAQTNNLSFLQLDGLTVHPTRSNFLLTNQS